MGILSLDLGFPERGWRHASHPPTHYHELGGEGPGAWLSPERVLGSQPCLLVPTLGSFLALPSVSPSGKWGDGVPQGCSVRRETTVP